MCVCVGVWVRQQMKNIWTTFYDKMINIIRISLKKCREWSLIEELLSNNISLEHTFSKEYSILSINNRISFIWYAKYCHQMIRGAQINKNTAAPILFNAVYKRSV